MFDHFRILGTRQPGVVTNMPEKLPWPSLEGTETEALLMAVLCCFWGLVPVVTSMQIVFRFPWSIRQWNKLPGDKVNIRIMTFFKFFIVCRPRQRYLFCYMEINFVLYNNVIYSRSLPQCLFLSELDVIRGVARIFPEVRTIFQISLPTPTPPPRTPRTFKSYQYG